MYFNYKDNRPLQLKINKKDLIRAFKSENNFNKFMNELIEKMINKQGIYYTKLTIRDIVNLTRKILNTRKVTNMTKQKLTVKNMIREYYNAKSDMDTVWNIFRSMYLMNFITWEDWRRFFKKCKSWTYDYVNDVVVDYSTGKEVNLYKAPKGAGYLGGHYERNFSYLIH